MTLSVADVLERAADLIEPEGAWTQGWLARDAQGAEVTDHDPAATCWCMLGAVFHELPKEHSASSYRTLLASTIGTNADSGLPNWNDAPERTQAEVVAKLREAANLARGTQQ